MCVQSSMDINHLHKHRRRLSNAEECVPSLRSAKVSQKVSAKGRGSHAVRGKEMSPVLAWAQRACASPPLPGSTCTWPPRVALFLSQDCCGEEGLLGEKVLAKCPVSYL